MSMTMRFETKRFGVVHMHHNTDFSGTVRISWTGAQYQVALSTFTTPPGEADHVAGKVISFMEQLGAEDLDGFAKVIKAFEGDE